MTSAAPGEGPTPAPRVQGRDPSRVEDPAPYAWMDLPFRPTPGQTVGFGVFFLGCALVYLVIFVVTYPGYVAGGIVFVIALFAVMGGLLVSAGRSRQAWRRRHPGVDPLTATKPRWGSTFGPASLPGAVARIVVLVVAWAGAAFCAVLAVAVLRAPDSAEVGASGRVGAFVLLLGVAAVLAIVGWFDLRRIRALRRARG